MAKEIPYEEKNFVDASKPVWNYSLFNDEDIRNFQNGTNYSLYKKFGSHALKVLNTDGYYFAVWVPNATMVSVVGDLIIGTSMRIACLSDLITQEYGKVLFPISKSTKIINIILLVMKDPNYSRAILLPIIGNCARELPPKPKTLRTNGTT